MCSLAQVSESALEQERRRSQAVERQRLRQEARWSNVFGRPRENLPAEITGWWTAEGEAQGAPKSMASFIVRADQEPWRSGLVPVHPDSFARTMWDLLLLASILLIILTDPVRCVPLCARLPAFFASPPLKLLEHQKPRTVCQQNP